MMKNKRMILSGRGGSSDNGGMFWHTWQRLFLCCLILAGMNRNIISSWHFHINMSLKHLSVIISTSLYHLL